MSTTTNGRPARKQLSDQLDRLDALLDTLGEGLNQAVADACREGTRAAVREVLMELIANPDLLAAVKPATAPAVVVTPDQPPAPSFWSRVKATAKEVVTTATGTARTLLKSAEGALRPVADALKLTGTTRVVLGVALGVGLLAGAVCLVCPSWVGALLATGSSATAIVAAHVGAVLNRVFASLCLA